MKKILLERSFVVALFVLVMIVFSFAERDTQKLFEKRNQKNTVVEIKSSPPLTAETPVKQKSSAD